MNKGRHQAIFDVVMEFWFLKLYIHAAQKKMLR